MTHNNDPITIPSLPPPLLIGPSDNHVRGANRTTPLEEQGEDLDRWHYVPSEQMNRATFTELQKEARFWYNVFEWKTAATGPSHKELYFADVPGLTNEETKEILGGYKAPLQHFRGSTLRQLEKLQTLFMRG